MVNKKIMGHIFSWSKVILFALSISIIVSAFIIQPFTVSGSSMEPTFEGEDVFNEDKVGDKVIIFKGGQILGAEPKLNDIVIIDSRLHQKRGIKDRLSESPILSKMMGNHDRDHNLWIKRIIGKEGDVLAYKNGKVYRNGEELVEDYMKEQMAFPFETVVVPDNHVFVMGDNRNHSRDSREIGPIPMENIVGKVFLRFHPFDKIKLF